VTVIERGEGRVGRWILDGVEEVLDGGKDQVVGGGEGHDDLGGEPRESVADALGSRVPNPDIVATIGFERWSSVPAIEGVRRPAGAVFGSLVSKHTDSWGGRLAFD
jgi:hypothetical protein